MSFASLADLVKNYESGGNYSAQNPTSTASGAYQFTNPTWQQYATQTGVDTSQYPTAASAPPAIQDAVFNQAVSTNGLKDWTCPGCNANISSYVANNDVSNLPITSAYNGAGGILPGDTTGQGYGGNGVTPATLGTGALSGGYIAPDGSYVPAQATPGVTADPNAAPLVGSTSSATSSQLGGMPGELLDQPFQFGLTTGLASAVNSWITGAETAVGTAFKNAMSGIFSSVANVALRGVLIALAFLLLLIALWRIMDPDGSKTRAVVRDAAVAA
jgi:hypothetical protein